MFSSVKYPSKEISRGGKKDFFISFNFCGKFLVNELEEFGKLNIIIWIFHMEI